MRLLNNRPIWARPEASTIRLSRSRLYLLAGEGVVRFVKVGDAALVDLGSLRSYWQIVLPRRSAHRKPPETQPPRARQHPERRIVKSQADTSDILRSVGQVKTARGKEPRMNDLVARTSRGPRSALPGQTPAQPLSLKD